MKNPRVHIPRVDAERDRALMRLTRCGIRSEVLTLPVPRDGRNIWVLAHGDEPIPAKRVRRAEICRNCNRASNRPGWTREIVELIRLGERGMEKLAWRKR